MAFGKLIISSLIIMQKIYEKLGLANNDLINTLYKVPKRETKVNAPHFQPISPGFTIQADLLFLPNDKGFKYALVVVDVGSRLIDAEPLKNKESVSIVKAFERIFHRKYVKTPQFRVEVDDGSEFKGSTIKYFQKLKVHMRVAKAGRHRQQGLVERVNQILGILLFKRMTAQELITGAVSREWVKDLKAIIPLLNEYRAKQLSKQKIKSPADTIDLDPLCSGDTCILLGVGDKVRLLLDNPINPVDDKRLHGRFRSTDVRFEPKVRTIKRVILTPNRPPMYFVSKLNDPQDFERVAYTKGQLQLVSDKEPTLNTKAVRESKNTQYEVEQLLDRKKIKNRIMFLVKWKNYAHKDNTWEPRSSLIMQVPKLVIEYESQH